jgi:hypothetical protein
MRRLVGEKGTQRGRVLGGGLQAIDRRMGEAETRDEEERPGGEERECDRRLDERHQGGVEGEPSEPILPVDHPPRLEGEVGQDMAGNQEDP